MRYVPIEDDAANLLERAARIGKITQLVELLELVEEKQVSIDELIERLKAGKPWELQPRIEEIESKVSELKVIAVDHGEWKRDGCKHYDGTKCTHYSYKKEPSAIFKTVKAKDIWRVVVKEQPEYCGFCPSYKDKVEVDIGSRLSVIANFAARKRDGCKHYDGTKCTLWQYEEQPSNIFKTVKDGKVWRVMVKDQPEYCASCLRYEEREEKK